VTAVAAGLAVATGRGPVTGVLVVAAVLAGQLSIGWSNDLIDVERDRQASRADKPAALGQVSVRALRVATGTALAACVVLSLAVGPASALVHLGLGVAGGWAYNLGLKATAASPLPYAVAFGALPSVITLAAPSSHGVQLAPAWMTLTGALLGVAAHLLNVLPDLEDDVRAGVRGLPHRLGEQVTRVAAVGLLVGGTVVAVLGPGRPPVGAQVVLVACVAAGVVGVFAAGRWPFVVGAAIAVVDVVLLAVRSPG
jgi:4-hydroxybenzoate polyprenyltransferase